MGPVLVELASGSCAPVDAPLAVKAGSVELASPELPEPPFFDPGVGVRLHPATTTSAKPNAISAIRCMTTKL